MQAVVLCISILLALPPETLTHAKVVRDVTARAIADPAHRPHETTTAPTYPPSPSGAFLSSLHSLSLYVLSPHARSPVPT